MTRTETVAVLGRSTIGCTLCVEVADFLPVRLFDVHVLLSDSIRRLDGEHVPDYKQKAGWLEENSVRLILHEGDLQESTRYCDIVYRTLIQSCVTLYRYAVTDTEV